MILHLMIHPQYCTIAQQAVPKKKKKKTPPPLIVYKSMRFRLMKRMYQPRRR